MEIILASQSPRRKELLAKIIPNFRVVPSSVDEATLPFRGAEAYVISAALAKAQEVASRIPEALVIGADTIVVFRGNVFGKPKTIVEAREMLRTLSGNRHQVFTGIAFVQQNKKKILTQVEISHVTFRVLSDEEIEAYLLRGTFSDKAGSYAVQEQNDSFVQSVDGDYENVVGFPTRVVSELLECFRKGSLPCEISDNALPDGYGVAKDGNRTLFVARAVVGDCLWVCPIRQQGKVVYAQILGFSRLSSSRGIPLCPSFVECGGCVFQNIVYEQQLLLKKNHLLQVFQRIAKINLQEDRVQIFGSPAPYFYRTKIELSLGLEENRVVLGFHGKFPEVFPAQKKIVPIQECCIFSKDVPDVLSVLKAWAARYRDILWPGEKGNIIHRVILRHSKKTEKFMVVLEFPSLPEEAHRVLWRELLEKSEQVTSLVIYKKKGSQKVGFPVVYGEKFLDESVAGNAMRVSPGTFIQPNIWGAEALYRQIQEETRTKNLRHLLSLYCGAGAIELCLAKVVEFVVGVDRGQANIHAARQNCRLNGIANCQFIQRDLEKSIPRFSRKFDCIILDPPRKGLTRNVQKFIAASQADVLLYVSCHPAVLARDIAGILEAEYVLSRVVAFDFFPQTAHMETLAVFQKKR